MARMYEARTIGRHAAHRASRTPSVRSFPRIAAILSRREGRSMSPSHVRQIVLAAEIKLARALLADPVMRELLGKRSQPSAFLFSPKSSECKRRLNRRFQQLMRRPRLTPRRT